MYQQDLQEYLCNKHGWTESIFNSVDWVAHGKALREVPYLQRITVIKLIHGWNATKRRRFRMGGVDSPQCQLCNEEEPESIYGSVPMKISGKKECKI